MRQMDAAPGLDLLRCFVELYRAGQVTRAARAAGLSQPAMSRALARLRDQFGDPLFVRGPRGLVPTPRAEVLAPEVERVLEAARSLLRPARFDPAQLVRTFVLGTTDFVDAVVVPGVIAKIAAIAPRVAIATRPVGDDTPDALALGRYDLVIVPRPAVPADAIGVALFDDGFVCAVRRDHPGVGARLTLDRFCALPHLQIAPRGTPGGPVDSALDALGRSRRVVVQTPTFFSAPLIVARSDLLLTAPTRLLAAVGKPFGLRILPAPLELARFEVWSAWHPRAHHDPAHEWFRGVVATVARATSARPER